MPRLRKYSSFALLLGALMLPELVFAASPGAFARLIGVGYADTRLVVLRVLQIVWLFASVGALGFLIYGFVLFRNADPEDLEEEPHAKRVMFYSGIALGAGILLLIIVSIVYGVIEGGYKKGGVAQAGEPLAPSIGGTMSIQALKVSDHYPARDEKNIPRDSSLLITFTENIQKESVLDSTNGIKKDSVLIRRSAANAFGDYGVVAATGAFSADGKTLKIIPTKMLGDANAKVGYTVALTGAIRTADGALLFDNPDEGYSWQFEVSGLVDGVPPFIESYLPVANSKNPNNHLVQITFSEPIDPFIVNTNFLSVAPSDAENKQISGTWRIGNNYRTLTFASNEACGTNQCGSPVFCLPQNVTLSARIQSASLRNATEAGQNANKAQYPYTGVVDIAGNAMDGGGLEGRSKNGKSEGAGADDFYWSFETTSEKQSTPPSVVSIQPGRDAEGISLTAPVSVLFSTFMDLTSLTVSSIGFSQNIQYWLTNSQNIAERRSQTNVRHDPFAAQTVYTPVVKSPVTDIYQNCFNPCNGPGVVGGGQKQ